MPAPQQDARGYDLGTYMPAASGQGAYGNDPLQSQAEWVHAAQVPYGDAGAAFEPHHHSGALEPAHNQEEAGDYEYDEPRRGSWMLRIAGAIVVAVGLGYGLAQGYKIILGGPSDPTTPVVKNDSAPAKSVPTDPGGKQFAHSDSKVMGRLGDAPPGDETGSAPAADTDSTGARKVQTVVVGRDGAIVPPAAPATPAPPPAASAAPSSPPGESVAVPGLTVIDGFGGRYPGNSVTTAAVPPQKPDAALASKPAATPPATKHAKAKAPTPPPPPPPAAEADAAAVVEEAPAPAAKPPAAPKKVAAATPAAAPAASAANGYVVVLASIPATSTSRLDALKRFADMQQKYGTVLANKTPEVQEANLGDKGNFNRLLVGPPGSRASATALCTELKAAGYKDCWVAAY
jgi:hypothetical protein